MWLSRVMSLPLNFLDFCFPVIAGQLIVSLKVTAYGVADVCSQRIEGFAIGVNGVPKGAGSEPALRRILDKKYDIAHDWSLWACWIKLTPNGASVGASDAAWPLASALEWYITG